MIQFTFDINLNKMEKELKKQKIEKLQKKLQNGQLSLYQILQEDVAIDWFRGGHPALLVMFNTSRMAQMFGYIAKVGPPDNKIRSYKIPMIATELLSTPIPKMPKLFQLCFLQDEEAKGGVVLGRLMDYFNEKPNYVISGYIVKILMNLMIGNPHQVMDFLIKLNVNNMLKFLQSQSIAEFILRIMIVQDLLINSHIKERLQLYNNIIDIYAANKQCQEILENVNFILTQSVIRLWTQKHKQLGRFSSSLFRIVELVIDNNNLHKQENLMVVLMKHLTLYGNQAPFVIIAVYKKIYKQLLLFTKNNDVIKNQCSASVNRFSLKNLRYLEILNCIFTNNAESITKVIGTFNIYTFLLQFPLKYEWNSMMLVQIERILKVTLNSSSEVIYNAIFVQGYLVEKIKQYIRKQNQGGKFKRGYSGFLSNILKYIEQIITTNTSFAQFMKKHHPDFLDTIQKYLNNKNVQLNQIQLNSYKVVHDVAMPYYNVSKLLESFKEFFNQTETINKNYQMERPLNLEKHVKEDVLHEIQKENELVYQLLTQVSQNQSNEEKKIQNDNANE